MAFFTDTRVNAMTQEAFLPAVFDQVIASTALSLRLFSNGKEWKGRQFVVPYKVVNSNQAQSFSGLDTFVAPELNTKQRGVYDLRAVRQPVAIAGLEIIANDYPETQIIDMVEEALEESQTELIDYVAGLFYANGTGNNNKDIIGVGAVVDDGSNVSTIGGLSRSTYPVLKGYYTSSAGVLSLAQMASLYSAISSGTALSTPTLAPTNPTVFDLYEQLLTPSVRENYSTMGRYRLSSSPDQAGGMSREGLSGESGFVSLSYKGVPLARDYKAPAGNLYMLDEWTIEWRGANVPEKTEYQPVPFSHNTIEGVYSEEPLKTIKGFNWSTFRAPINQFGVVADIIIAGNLIPKRPNRNGLLYAITSI